MWEETLDLKVRKHRATCQTLSCVELGSKGRGDGEAERVPVTRSCRPEGRDVVLNLLNHCSEMLPERSLTRSRGLFLSASFLFLFLMAILTSSIFSDLCLGFFHRCGPQSLVHVRIYSSGPQPENPIQSTEVGPRKPLFKAP